MREPGSGRRRRHVAVATGRLVLLIVLLVPGVATPQAPDGAGGAGGPQKRVLLLHAESRQLPSILRIEEAFRATLQSGWRGELFFHVEQLDLSLFDGGTPVRELRELLRLKYGSTPPDLVVATDSRMLRIAVANRTTLFSWAPIVFTSVDRAAAGDIPLDQDITGTWLTPGWAATLEAALSLQPGTRRAVVIVGTGPIDRVWLASARQQLTPYQGRLDIVYLTDVSMADALGKVAALPPDSVVLKGTFVQDAAGQRFITRDATARIAAVSSVPVYGLGDTQMDTGLVGGQMVSFEAHGRVAAELALRVLRGERPPPVDTGTLVPMFDWRQLRRWGLDERRLPAGSVVRFREPSAWERYRWWIVGAVTLVLLQSTLVAALLVHRALRRRAQRALAERLRFETLVTDVSALFAAGAVSDVAGEIETALRRLGKDLEIDRATLATFPPFSDEVRVTHSWTRDGVMSLREMLRGDEVPWIVSELRRGSVVRLGQPGDLPMAATVDRRSLERFGTRSGVVVPLVVGGSTIGGLAVATLREARPWPEELVPRLRILADLFASALARQDAERTAHESATQSQTLAGRLITAQEEERRRIARELHDGVNQKLSALSIALTTLGRRLPVRDAGLTGEVARLQERAAGLVEEVRHLSHELHPGVLQHVGLVAGLQGYCEEFEAEHGLGVAFEAEGDLGGVPVDRALCLYRATQEALGNVAKHAKARHARVTVVRDDTDVRLTVADDGCGFDVTQARGRGGLGLISLDERVRLAGGQLTIHSSPEAGTEVRIVVPLPESPDAAPDGPAR